MNTNKRLIQKARSTGLLFPVIVIFGFLAGGLVVWQSWLLSGVVSNVFLAKHTLSQVMPLLRMILIIVMARAIFAYLNESLAGVLAVKIKNALREELLNKISRLGPVFLKRERSGELATTALQGMDALDAYFGQFLPQILLAALLPITILVVVFPIDLLTGIVFLVTAPLIPFFMIWIGKLSQNHTQRQWTALSRLGAYFLDTLQGLSALMTLGRSRERALEIRSVSERYRIVTMNVLRITFLSAFVLEMIATISTALVAVEIGLRLLYSRMEFQQAFFVLLIAPEFYLPLRNLSVRYHAGMNGVAAAKRIFELLDTPEVTVKEMIGVNNLLLFEHPFLLKFRDVSFAYQGSDHFALEHLNIEIESGRHYALVGESGAGKSTIAQLLMRFIIPDSGQILLNGEDIQNFDLEKWRSNFAWISQNPRLFNTSLLENVRMNYPTFTRYQVQTALKQASLEDFLVSLPNGLDTQIQEGGASLSGGEARRVALARAFLKNSSLLIMDEPTAHLDLELEKTLAGSTKLMQSRKTTLTIAHRLSTVIEADVIFVLRNGHLVEQGRHDELMTKNGEYRHLIDSAWRVI